MKIYDILINLLHNPFSMKNYRDLKDHYEKEGKFLEAKAFEKLIDDNNSHTLQKQPRNNQKDP